MTMFIALFTAPFILFTLAFSIELLIGLKPLRHLSQVADGEVRATIVVPAHDEAEIIGIRLAELRGAADRQAQILVVADNCVDATAEVARKAGVEVIERFDTDRRGKGFALDFARSALTAHPPDVIIIIDADCSTDGKSIAALIAQCAATGRPCQAVNLQRPALDASPAVQLSTFAFYIKNVIRQRALQRIAGHGHLFGTGMAIPWPLFASADLATSNIVEDLKLGIELASAGRGPLLVEGARVWSDPETKANTLAQRRRWEGGFLQNAISNGPHLFAARARNGDFRGMWAAFDLLIPPFTLLLAIDVAALMLVGLIIVLAGLSLWPLAVLMASVVLAGVGLGMAWIGGGSRFVRLRSLAQAPLYILWKLPLYFALIRKGAPTEWLRTRGGGAAPGGK